MREDNQTARQHAEKQSALHKAMPALRHYEPDLHYQTKDFTRAPKSGLMSMPNHLGDGIVMRSLEKRRS